MDEYNKQLSTGMDLAVAAANRSAELDEQAHRVGARWPIPPSDHRDAGDEYRQAWQREAFASAAFWAWLKHHGHILTDADLGKILRALAGHN